MVSSGDIWESLGNLKEDESTHVLTRLYSTYEAVLRTDPGNKESLHFFQHLENAITYCVECNLNRR